MGQHADYLVLYQCGLQLAQLAPPLWFLHKSRHPEPVHHFLVYSSVLYFPVKPAQCYVRARQRLNEIDMYCITNPAIPHPPPARSTGLIPRNDSKVDSKTLHFPCRVPRKKPSNSAMASRCMEGRTCP